MVSGWKISENIISRNGFDCISVFVTLYTNVNLNY